MQQGASQWVMIGARATSTPCYEPFLLRAARKYRWKATARGCVSRAPSFLHAGTGPELEVLTVAGCSTDVLESEPSGVRWLAPSADARRCHRGARLLAEHQSWCTRHQRARSYRTRQRHRPQERCSQRGSAECHGLALHPDAFPQAPQACRQATTAIMTREPPVAM